jgi:hypothetical protein
MSDFHRHLVFIYMLQLQAKYIPNMAKNSVAQYEVVVVDDEDGVQWRRWRRWQHSTTLKTKARQWRGEEGV